MEPGSGRARQPADSSRSRTSSSRGSPRPATTTFIPRHGAVLAYLDEDGVRATELARLSGRHKQIVGRLVDELEELGYVERRPGPGGPRAKLIVPTERGLEQIRLGDEIVAEIEARHAEASRGPRPTPQFRDVLRGVVARDRDGHCNAS